MLVVRPLIEAKKPAAKKAFLLSGAFNPYTIGHEEAARQAAHYARKTGHTHLYHGIGSSANVEDAPLSARHKRRIVRASQKHIKKDVKGIKMGVLATEHDTPFKQVLHLAKTGHSHVTLGLGSDQMKKKALRGALERHVAQHGGMIDQEGKVHPVKLSFKKMGKTRDERPLHRTELLGRLKKGDLSVAKAGHLRKAVRTGDTELAHALMPASVNRAKYHKMIQNAQSKINAKKNLKKKLTEGLLSFSEFITEAPELDAYIEPGETKKEPFNVSYLKKKRHTFDSKSFVGHKRMGDIHPKYEMWRHTTELTDNKGNKYHQHQFSIVHKDTRKKVGEIDATGGKINRKTGEHRAGTGRDLKIGYLGIHDDHSAKKVGTSLAVAAYKHLHKLGHSIKSDTRQSFGGAHVWDTLRKDPEIKRNVKFHDERDNKAISAHKLPYGGIWQEHPSAQETTLVLHAKPKKKAAVVSEDIEMANILAKPHGGYHRDFTRMIKGRGEKPKRSGKIAKGYTLHTSTDKDDPRVQTHYIVHDATNHVAGEVTTRHWLSSGDHEVVHTDVHGDHTKKKIGKSLAMLAYKHLAKKKGNLVSSNLQSPGGASIWNRLRKDPRMKGKIFHQSVSGEEVPAHDLPDKRIWASGVKIERSKSTPGYLPASRHHDREHENILRSRLVIRPAKKS